MLVLFDNGTPRTLARFLIDQHTVTEARSRGWAELSNGDLLREAELAGFEVLVTTDRNISYQQNLLGPQDSDCRSWQGPVDSHSTPCGTGGSYGKCRQTG